MPIVVHLHADLKNPHLKESMANLGYDHVIGSVDYPRMDKIDGPFASFESTASDDRVKIIISRRIMDWI